MQVIKLSDSASKFPNKVQDITHSATADCPNRTRKPRFDHEGLCCKRPALIFCRGRGSRTFNCPTPPTINREEPTQILGGPHTTRVCTINTCTRSSLFHGKGEGPTQFWTLLSPPPTPHWNVMLPAIARHDDTHSPKDTPV